MRKLMSFVAMIFVPIVVLLSFPNKIDAQNSPYCETQVTHFAGDPPSAIKLTIANLDATSMLIEIESADADPVDLLIVLNGSGATISGENTSVPGKISRTLSWGAAPDSVDLNLLWSKVSFGGNWQLSTSDIKVAFDDTCSGIVPPPPPTTTIVNFAVNMNAFGGSFGTVYVSGDFQNWCGGCNPLSDPDLDGIWTGSYTIVGDSIEFKYQLDQWAQQETLAPGTSCTKTSGSFTNRFTALTGGTLNLPAYCYGSCNTVCTVVTPTKVKFAVDMSNYTSPFTTAYVAGEFNGWCGNCDPLSDPDGDSIWTGCITTTLDSFEYKFELDDWATSEFLGPNLPCTKTAFGFTNRFIALTQDTVCTDTVCYGACIQCLDPVDLTFIVDMSEQTVDSNGVHIVGPFNGFDPAATPLSPIGGGLYSVTVSGLQAGVTLNYKFLNGNTFGGAENIDSGPCAANNGFGDRTLIIPTSNATFGPDCFGYCGPCSGCGGPDLTQSVLLITIGSFSFPEEISWSLVCDQTGDTLASAPCGSFAGAPAGTYIIDTFCLNDTQTYTFNAYDDWGDGWNGSSFSVVKALDGCTISAGAPNNGAPGDGSVGCGGSDLESSTTFSTGDPLSGCTDPSAANYDPCASVDDGSCIYPGCTDLTATNYDPSANANDGSCVYAAIANAVCDSAETLTLQLDSCSSSTVGVLVTDTTETDPGPSCAFYQGSDVWYSLTVGASGKAVIEANSLAGSAVADMGMAIYENDCDTLVEIECDDDDGNGLFPRIEYNGAPNSTILIRAWEFGGNVEGGFTICAYEPRSVVNFAVNMSQYGLPFGTVYVSGTFNGWCGGCDPLTDQGNGIWTGSIVTTEDSIEFKYQVDQWNDQENLTPGSSCTKTTGSFTNRFLIIDEPVENLPAYCWGSCGTTCAPITAKKVKVAVDMSSYSGAFTTAYVAGEFNGWCGNCDPLSDADGDSIWTGCITTTLDSFEYKFELDDWATSENLTPNSPCTKTAFGFTNRFILLDQDTVCADTVCYGSCSICLDPVDLTFILDMSQEIVDSNGVHIVGPFNGFNPAATPLTPIGGGLYSVTITGLQPGIGLNYKFLNGNTFGGAENINSGPCAANNGFGDRTLVIPATNTTFGPDCFGLCGPCPIALCDSGQTPYEIFISAASSQFPNEMSWMLINTTTGDTVLDVPCGTYTSGQNSTDTVCLDDGDTYVFNANDDWGDGWNGGAYFITDLSDGTLLAAGFPDNTNPGNFTDDCIGADIEESISWIGGGAAIIPGCTDSTSINYNPLATIDDSSCLYAAVNDICDSSMAIPVIGTSDTCDYLVQNTQNSTADATSQSLCDPVGVNLDLWYTFVAPPSGNINFDIILGTSPLIEAAIYEACGDSVIGCFNTLGGTAFSGFTPGQEYVLQLWTDDFNAGIFGICLQEFIAGCTDPLAQNYNPLANIEDGSCIYPTPANDLCSNSTLISCGDTASGVTLGASADTSLPICGTILTTASGVWYRIQGTSDTIEVRTCGSTFDTKLGVFSGNCNNLTCVGGNDDACGPTGLPPRQSVVRFASQVGVTYYIYVTGFGLEAGAYQLTVNCTAAKCPSPKNLTSTQTSATTVELDWDEVAGANNYVIRGNKVGTPGFVYLQASAPPKSVNGLNMTSSYFWQVQAICSGNTTNPVSAFSLINTFTMLPCAAPTGVSTTNITSTTATLVWDAVPGALGYKVRGRKVGTNQYANLTVANNTLIATGLDPSSTYEWTVRVICSNGIQSNRSALQTFSTTGGAKTGEFTAPEMSFTIYPNPARDQFTLETNSLERFDNVQVNMFDIQGKLVHNYDAIDITGSLNVNVPTAIENGMYQVIVTYDGQIFQEKLVIVR